MIVQPASDRRSRRKPGADGKRGFFMPALKFNKPTTDITGNFSYNIEKSR